MRAYISEQFPDADPLNPARDTMKATMYTPAVRSTFAARLAAITSEKPEPRRTWTVTRAIEPMNSHADCDEAAKQRFLTNLNRKGR